MRENMPRWRKMYAIFGSSTEHDFREHIQSTKILNDATLRSGFFPQNALGDGPAFWILPGFKVKENWTISYTVYDKKYSLLDQIQDKPMMIRVKWMTWPMTFDIYWKKFPSWRRGSPKLKLSLVPEEPIIESWTIIHGILSVSSKFFGHDFNDRTKDAINFSPFRPLFCSKISITMIWNSEDSCIPICWDNDLRIP